MHPNTIPVEIVYLDNYHGNPLTLQHEGDSGYDLCAAKIPPQAFICGVEFWCVPKKETRVIPTGIKVAIPLGFEMQVRTRSGSPLKRHFFVANSPGTVDSGYRGEVGVIIHNLSDHVLFIEPGERIAQAVFSRVYHATFNVVTSLDETDRGDGAYNSTGVK